MAINQGIFPLGGTDNAKRKLDVVFVHGLGGDAFTTWQSSHDAAVMWPQWLAEDVPELGVWTIGYGATPSRWVEDTMAMESRALNLINHLSIKNFGDRPIIFITHSMGGLITKHIFEQAHNNNKPEYKRIADNTVGVIFLAVPHDGSGWASLLDAARILVRGNQIVEQLQKDQPGLLRLSNAFNQLVSKNKLVCLSFFETKELRVRKRFGWKGIKVVSESSAQGNFPQETPIGLDDDHISICKLDSRDEQLYGNVLAFINKQIATKPAVTEPPTSKPKLQISKLPHTNGQLFGRQDELMLLDSAWADQQTNILSLKAMGGTGKTALMQTWLNNLALDNYRGAQAVYTWSFYSQGAAEDKQSSSDEFFAETLKWFGYQGESITSAHNKGLKLAELINQQKTLLLLDGLEPLQHPVGTMRGELKDPGLKALLQQLAGYNQGLCLISSRQDIVEIQGKPQVHGHNLNQLATDDGVALIQHIGVHGRPEELKLAVEDIDGHALSLNLLGQYLKTVCHGDIRQREQIPGLLHERENGQHAEKIMAAYQSHLAGSTGLAILYLMGLFDRPISNKALQHLRDANIPELTDHLSDQSDWLYALADLRAQNLINSENPDHPETLDTHPLVREYFGQQLKKLHPEAWQLAHQSLYHYYKDIPEQDQPDTLAEMEPLFAAISHGCAAGLAQQALDEVYWPRIRRETEMYLCKKLGAFGAELAAVSQFFAAEPGQPWQTPAASLTEGAKAAVLNFASFDLRALGRLQEAVQPMQAGLDRDLEREDWENAAIAASNLSELQLTLGEVNSAVKAGEQSVQLADQSGDDFQRMGKRTTLADAQHQAGEPVKAGELFAEVEQLLQQEEPDSPQLYSLWGFRYCELLLAANQGQAVWQRADYALEISIKFLGTLGLGLLDIALDKLSLGRANLQLALSVVLQNPDLTDWVTWFIPTPDSHAPEKESIPVAIDSLVGMPMQAQGNQAALSPLDNAISNKTLQTAKNWLDQAVDGLREAGREDYLPRGLLARASYQRYAWVLAPLLDLADANTGSNNAASATATKQAALQDLQEAHDIAERGGMRLHLTDYHLEAARLAITTGQSIHQQSADWHLNQARTLIDDTGYKRRLPDLAYLQEYAALAQAG